MIKTAIKTKFIFLIIISLALQQNFLYGQSNTDSLAELAMNSIWKIKEVKKLNKNIIKTSKNTRKLSLILCKEPEENAKYYWIKVAEDNGSNFVTYFHFFVYPTDWKIKFYNVINDEVIELQEWRKLKLQK